MGHAIVTFLLCGNATGTPEISGKSIVLPSGFVNFAFGNTVATPLSGS